MKKNLAKEIARLSGGRFSETEAMRMVDREAEHIALFDHTEFLGSGNYTAEAILERNQPSMAQLVSMFRRSLRGTSSLVLA